MDTTKFLKILKQAVREVVKEEINLALRKELAVIREHVQPSAANISRNTTNDVTKKTISKRVTQREYTKNKLLNDLLNESTPFGSDAYTQDAITFTSNDVHGFGASAPSSVLQDIEGNVVPVNNEATEAIANAVTRDYRDLMKAINAKKGK